MLNGSVMGSKQFLRVARLLVGSGTEAVDLEGLRISFEIVRDLFGAPDTAKINVYNINKEHRDSILERYQSMRLDAGYKDNVKTLYNGDLVNADHTRDATEGITILFGSDGAIESKKLVNFTLPPGSVPQDAINKIAEQAGLDVGDVVGVPSLPYARGVTFSGPAQEALNKVGSDHRLNWTIQDKKIQMVEETSAIGDQTTAILVSAATGLKGSPTITEVGVDFDTLLNPDIQPGKLVKIESLGANVSIGDRLFFKTKATIGSGFYKVRNVVHTGDSFQGEWVSRVKTEAI